MNSDIVKEVSDKVLECYRVAEKHFNRILTPLPKIEYNLKGKTAGLATSYVNPPLIELNPHFFNTNYEDMINQTVPHEVAHIITDKVYGDLPRHHGKEWKSVMHLFGLEPKRCHNYDVSHAVARKTRKFKYYCRCFDCCTTGLNLHKKIQNREIRWCSKCKKILNDCPWEEI